ncbi:MAG: methionine/alanine import family NSS transporter small subunit [Ancrocorticia sp.]
MPAAIAMFLVSAGLLWGGLVWSLLRLRKHPDIPDDDVPSPTKR